MPATPDGDRPTGIDNAAILSTLAGNGYDGPVTLMPDASQFSGGKREDIVGRVKAALDHVWSTAGLNKSGKLVSSGP